MNLTEEKIKKLTKIFKGIALVLGLVLIIEVFGLFALLIKVKGNISYVHNYLVKTVGGLEVRFNGAALSGADASAPYAVDSTSPSERLNGTGLMVNGTRVTDYVRTDSISFTEDFLENFTSMKGIITYRGNYCRSLTAYGQVSLEKNKISSEYWTYKTGKFLKCDGANYWSGNGWTGQPLAVEWDDSMKKLMNLYPEAKNKEGLVEVIYPGMDGMIHFLDMETGKETRPAINVGMTFKGTASIHPEYPILFCGSGDSAPGLFGEQVSARVFVYSLIDGTKLYEFGANDNFAPRVWHAYDSSAIIDPKTDTVIYPGENGILYTLKLNTSFDPLSGALSINPGELVQYKYDAKSVAARIDASEGEGGYGSESSAVVWENYLFFGDNGGVVTCLDLNTMKPVWIQDLQEDINSSLILDITEDGQKFIYAATTLKYNTDANHTGEAGLYKLNAMTGEIVWEKPYQVHTVLGLAGGFLSTGANGEGAVSDYIFYSVSKVPAVNSCYIVAISKRTGEEYWRLELDCDAWSSGGLLYDTDGSVKLVQCCGNGDILLIDAKSGNVLSKKNFGSNIESTPCIYKNRLVVGLRSEYILGIKFE